MRRIINFLPNLLTLCNLMSGALGVIAILHYESYTWCAIFIGVGAVFDFLDGWVARLLRASSPIGADLDSLSDVLTFGLTPSVLAFMSFRMGLLARGFSPEEAIMMAAPFLLLLPFAAYRLAKFNNDTGSSFYFRGLPVPANALLWIGVGLSCTHCTTPWMQWLLPYYALLLATSWMMVNNTPMLSLKHIAVQIRTPRGWILLVGWLVVLLSGLVSGIMCQDVAIGIRIAILMYIIVSLLLGREILRVTASAETE